MQLQPLHVLIGHAVFDLQIQLAGESVNVVRVNAGFEGSAPAKRVDDNEIVFRVPDGAAAAASKSCPAKKRKLSLRTLQIATLDGLDHLLFDMVPLIQCLQPFRRFIVFLRLQHRTDACPGLQ